MNWAWIMGGPWLLPGLLAGGLVLLLAWALARATNLPAHSQRLGEWGLGAALIATVFSFGPAWWTISLPVSETVVSPSRTVPKYFHPQNPGPEDSEPAGLPALVEPPLMMETEAFSDMEEGSILPPMEESLSPPGPEDFQKWPPPSAAESGDARSPAGFPGTWSVPELAGWIGFGHVLACLGVLIYWLAGHLGLYRLLCHSSPVPEEVGEIAREVGGEGRLPRLLQSPRVLAPLSCGLIRPTVVLPVALCSTPDPAALRWVLAHELTHLRRCDPWTCLLFGLGAVIFFPWPWFWWLRRRVRLCQEYIADGRAVSLGGPVEDYAEFLLRLRTAPALPGTALGGLGHSSDLYRRVTMLLKTRVVVSVQTSRWWSLGAAGILLALAVLLAGIGLRAEAASVGADDVDLWVQAKKEQPKKEPPAQAQEKQEGWLNLEIELLDLQKLFPEGMPPDIQEKIQAEQARLQKILEQVRQSALTIRFQNQAKLLAQQDRVRQERDRALKAYEEARKQFPQYAFQPNIPLQFFSPDGRLGVRIEKPSGTLVEQLDLPRDQGVVIEEVVPGSPAAKAGLKVNDILLQLGGKTIPNNPAEVVRLIGKLQTDKPMEAVVLRKGKKETIKGLSLPEKKERWLDLKFVQPAPMVPQQPLIWPRPGAGVMTTVFRSAERYTARHQEGNLVLTVTGTVAGGKAQTKEIAVQDGAVVNKYDSVEKVPDQYRDKVKNLVEMAEKGAVKVEIHSK